IILSVSSLAFLGFFKSNSANLGAILNDAAGEDLSNNLWAVMLPALILLSISISLHFVALGVHDALDPKVMKAK
ncbi:ABC transporter permease, partial [Mycoplasmopsis pullorum]